jgi:hypothetical protein
MRLLIERIQITILEKSILSINERQFTWWGSVSLLWDIDQFSSHLVECECVWLCLGTEELIHHLRLSAYNDNGGYLSVLCGEGHVRAHATHRGGAGDKAVALQTLVLANMLGELAERVGAGRALGSAHQIGERHCGEEDKGWRRSKKEINGRREMKVRGGREGEEERDGCWERDVSLGRMKRRCA